MDIKSKEEQSHVNRMKVYDYDFFDFNKDENVPEFWLCYAISFRILFFFANPVRPEPLANSEI